jgi:hypothetical protein
VRYTAIHVLGDWIADVNDQAGLFVHLPLGRLGKRFAIVGAATWKDVVTLTVSHTLDHSDAVAINDDSAGAWLHERSSSGSKPRSA